MSLFQPERLHVGIGRDGLALVRTAGWRSPRILADQWIPLDLGTDHGGLANALRSAIAAHVIKPANTKIVLADSLVRYFVVDRPKGLRDVGELESLMNAQFEAQFGLPNAEWRLTAEVYPFAKHDLVCAAPRALLNILTEEFKGTKAKVQSVRPFFVSETGRLSRSFRSKAHWFVSTLGNDRLTVYRDHTGWRGVQVETGVDSTSRSVSDTVRQVALRLGLPGTAPILCVGASQLPKGDPSGIRVIDAPEWPGRGTQWSRHHRVALSGIWPCLL